MISKQIFYLLYWCCLLYCVYYMIFNMFSKQHILPRRIIIMRHAEKDNYSDAHHDYDSNLNAKGWQRSILFPIFFNNFGHVPDAIYVPQFMTTNNYPQSYRSYQTIFPFALRNHISLTAPPTEVVGILFRCYIVGQRYGADLMLST